MSGTTSVRDQRPLPAGRRGAGFVIAVIAAAGAVGFVVSTLVVGLSIVAPEWDETTSEGWPGPGRDFAIVVAMFAVVLVAPVGVVLGCLTGVALVLVDRWVDRERHRLRLILAVSSAAAVGGGTSGAVLGLFSRTDDAGWVLIAGVAAVL
jgi:MFS family permease